MAREIHEREDLLGDARALVPRAMMRVALDGQQLEVFAGFRGESLSLYFDGDPAYHFNSRGELRRAFIADQLVKAEQGRLVVLARERRDNQLQLWRQDSDAARDQAVLGEVRQRLAQLSESLSAGEFTIVGQVPPDGDAVARLQLWLAGRAEPKIAASPRVG